MEYSHSDRELVEQPIGYWSWAAYKSVVTYIRAGLADFGVTQPQWWILAQAARRETPPTRAEVIATLKGYLDAGPVLLNEEVDTLLARGLLETRAAGGAEVDAGPEDTGRTDAVATATTATGDEEHLVLTPEGAQVFADCVARQNERRATIHHGISDEEYLVTLKVLQRMIRSTGGEAWHE